MFDLILKGNMNEFICKDDFISKINGYISYDEIINSTNLTGSLNLWVKIILLFFKEYLNKELTYNRPFKFSYDKLSDRADKNEMIVNGVFIKYKRSDFLDPYKFVDYILMDENGVKKYKILTKYSMIKRDKVEIYYNEKFSQNMYIEIAYQQIMNIFDYFLMSYFINDVDLNNNSIFIFRRMKNDENLNIIELQEVILSDKKFVKDDKIIMKDLIRYIIHDIHNYL